MKQRLTGMVCSNKNQKQLFWVVCVLTICLFFGMLFPAIGISASMALIGGVACTKLSCRREETEERSLLLPVLYSVPCMLSVITGTQLFHHPSLAALCAIGAYLSIVVLRLLTSK